MERRKILLIGLLMIVVSAVAGTLGGYLASQRANSVAIEASSVPSANLTSAASSGSLASLVNQIAPAVVDITSQTTTYSYFGGPTTETGAGTGMILTSNGYILTNNHVLPINSQSVTVTLANGHQYKAKVIATNATQDFGLIKINASHLPTVTLGDSSQMIVGDSVMAIGNALGQYQNSVVQGIISGLNRSVQASDPNSLSGGESLSGLFQTDAPINPGDSGGPLIDINSGTVIGIDTAVASNGQGIGFAIPIDQAKSFIAPYVNLVTS